MTPKLRMVAGPNGSGKMRRQWLGARESFTFETVMSSSDKVQLFEKAIMAGYRTYLYYVCTESSGISRQRVESRVQQGGHTVPEEKIATRYDRSLKLLPEAINLSSRAYIFDNSGESHRFIAEYEQGVLKNAAADLPGWFVRSVLASQL